MLLLYALAFRVASGIFYLLFTCCLLVKNIGNKKEPRVVRPGRRKEYDPRGAWARRSGGLLFYAEDLARIYQVRVRDPVPLYELGDGGPEGPCYFR